MGLIGAVIESFTRKKRGTAEKSEIIVDPGSGANITAECFNDPSTDAQPASKDIPLLIRVGNRYAVVGYIDPVNKGQTAAGEYRIMGRTPAGEVKSSAWLKADGKLLVNELVEIDDAGNITTPADMFAANYTATANMNCVNLIASAAITCATLAATGAITAASISAGAISTAGTVMAAAIQATGAITAASVTATGDVLAGAISLNSHTHTVDGDPGVTGPPQ